MDGDAPSPHSSPHSPLHSSLHPSPRSSSPHTPLPHTSSYYDVLGVTPDCMPDEMASRYRQECLQCHPDHHPGRLARFKAVQEAYAVLKDPASRAQYDRWLRADVDVPFGVWRERTNVAHWQEAGPSVQTTHAKRTDTRRRFRDYQV